MVANPMQRKARNSFLLGTLITLIICVLLFVLFYVLVVNKDKKKEKEKGEKVKAYVLNQNVKSGDIITSNLLTQIEVYSSMIPSNYINSTQLSNLQLQDDEGNIVYTNSEGKMYIIQEENNNYKSITDNKDDKNRVAIDCDEIGYYKTTKAGGKVYVEFLTVPVVAKIDMYKNSIVTMSQVTKSDSILTNDTRYIEYNMLILPTTICEGDFIDIRLTLPNGQDLIVASKKEVKTILGDTIGLELTESEILMMESAIVEAYIMTASKLYAIQYVEPGMQEAAAKTYTPTEAVQGLIQRNPNIANTAKIELQARFNADIRTWTNADKGSYAATAKDNLEDGIEKQIKDAKAAREAYLAGLTSY